jgi:hypothetical protein
MDVSIMTGITAGIVLGLLGILSAGAPRPKRRPIPVRKDDGHRR